MKIFMMAFFIAVFALLSLCPAPVMLRYKDIFISVILIVFLVLLIRKRFALFKITDFWLWIYIIAIGLNVFFCADKDTAFSSYINIALALFLLYYIFRAFSESWPSPLIFYKIVGIFSILVSTLAIFEAVFRFNPLYKYYIQNPYYQRYITGFVRPMSTQYSPAPLGSYLVASLPFNFLLFKRNKSLWRILGGVGIVLNTVVLILTFSRGAFLGLIMMVIFYSFMQRKYISITVFSTILLIFVFMSSLFPYPLNRFSKDYIIANKGTAAFSNYRVDRYLMTRRIIKEHPLVGIGLQHFRIRFYEYYPGKGNVPYEFMIADNMYLTILAETGIIGFSGFLIFILSLFRKTRRKLSLFKDRPQRRQQLLLILTAFVGLLVNMAGYELFYWPNPYIYFCILIGLLEAFPECT